MQLVTRIQSRTAQMGSSLQVKVCGIMNKADALHAASMGADMVGLVFAPSRRRITPQVGARIVAALNAVERPPLVVGVFVNDTEGIIHTVAGTVRLDIIQLSGDETPAEVGRIACRYPVIKALRFPHDTPLNNALGLCREYLSSAPMGSVQLLVDTYRPGSYGGTGETADWSLAARLAARYPIFVAGGLTPDNVGQAIEMVNPSGVDVSSGVEREGTKDHNLIREFVHIAKARAAEQPPRVASGKSA